MKDQNTEQRLKKLEAEIQRLKQEKHILEQQLRMKDGQLRLILDQSPVVLTSILNDGTIELSVGKGLERMGLTAATLIGRNVEEAFQLLPIALEAIRQALEGEQSRLVFPFRPDLWIQNDYIPIYNEAGEVERVYAVSLDVSMAVLQYHKHQPGIDYFSKDAQFTPSAVAVFDKNLICIFVSEKWREDFLEEGEEMLNRHFYEAVPSIPERWKAIHQRSLKGHSDWAVNDYFCTAEGVTSYLSWRSMPWYEQDGEIGGFIILTSLNCRIDSKGNTVYKNEQANRP